MGQSIAKSVSTAIPPLCRTLQQALFTAHSSQNSFLVFFSAPKIEAIIHSKLSGLLPNYLWVQRKIDGTPLSHHSGNIRGMKMPHVVDLLLMQRLRIMETSHLCLLQAAGVTPQPLICSIPRVVKTSRCPRRLSPAPPRLSSMTTRTASACQETPTQVGHIVTSR